VLLVHRKRENARIGFEDEGRPVAVVNVEIDDRDPLQAASLQNARRDRDVVEGTESFPVVRKRVMETTTDVASDTKV
jgi:hypothetical protein